MEIARDILKGMLMRKTMLSQTETERLVTEETAIVEALDVRDAKRESAYETLHIRRRQMQSDGEKFTREMERKEQEMQERERRMEERAQAVKRHEEQLSQHWEEAFA